MIATQRPKAPTLDPIERIRLQQYAKTGTAAMKRDELDVRLWRRGLIIPTLKQGVDSFDVLRRSQAGDDSAIQAWAEANISTRGMLLMPELIEPAWRLRHAVGELYGEAGGPVERESGNNFGPDDRYGTWDAIIEAGKNYLVGRDVPTDQFIRAHRRSMKDWQRLAYHWARRNPGRELLLESERPRRSWVIYLRGEVVCLDLPHHMAGGEKGYVSRDGKSMVKVNDD